MSVRFKADHITTETGLTVRIEIFDAEFAGTSTKGKGVGGSFARFTHQQLDPRDPYSNPIQSGELSASVYIRNATEQTLLDDILNANETRFRMRYYIGEVLQWEGFILPDLSSYVEDRTPYVATFVAKDFTALKGIDYLIDSALPTGRATLISVISDLLDELGTGGDIFADTSFTNSQVTTSQDYLRQIYIDRTALRTFARTGDEPDEAITYYEALTKVLSNNRLVIKQIAGAYYIRQFTAYTAPTTVNRARYGSNGVLINESSQNVTDTNQRVTIQSVNNGNPGIKRAQVRFDHRTTVSGIQLPSSFRLDDQTLSRVFTQFFNTDGTQALSLNGLVRARFDETVTDATVLIQIKALSRYWNVATNAWQVNNIANPLEMTDTESSGGKLFFERPVSITTSNIPDTAGNTIEVTFFVARQVSSSIVSDFTDYLDFSFAVINPTVAEGNSTAIDYQLTRFGDFSILNQAKPAWFGDGPTSYAPSAYSADIDGLDLTASDWGRRGETLNQDFFEVHLREAIDLQRSWTRRLSAEIKSNYRPESILSYDSEFFGYMGGTFDLYRGVWSVELLRINIQTALTDTFEIIFRTSADASTGSAPASGGSTGGGMTVGFGDSRYNRRALNLSDVADTATARTNLDVYSTGEVDAIDNALSAEIDGVEADSKSRDASLSLSLDFLSKTKAEAGTQITLNTTGGLEGGSVINLTDDATLNVGIANLGVTTAKLNDGAVTTPKLNDLSVTNGKLATNAVSTAKILDGNVTNAKLANSTISGKALGTDLDSLSAGDGLTGTAYNGSVARTFSADVVAPIAIQSGKIGLSRNEPLFTNGTALDIRDHADGVRGVLLPTPQSIFGDKTFQAQSRLANNAKLNSSAGYASGFTGSGFQLAREGTLWRLELDDMFIRGALFASEFIINQITALNGSDFLSPAVGKVEVITGTAPNEVVTLSDPQLNPITGLVANDIVIVQQVTPAAFNGAGGQIVKRIVRRVASVSANVATLSALTDAPTDAGSIEVGDIMVVLGNTTVANRQAHIYRSVIDSGAPFVRINDGVSDFESFGELSKLKLQYGNLEGLSSLGASGYGFYSANAFLTGQLTVGDLTKTGNYLEYDGTNLKVVANEVFIGATNLATELDDLSESFLNLQSDIVQLSLANGFQQSGLTLLAGQAVLKAFDVTEDGRGRLAQIDLDATVDSGSQIRLFADDIMLDATTSIQAKVGTIDGSISALQLTQNTFDLFTSSSSAIGNTELVLEGTITQVQIRPDFSATIYTGTVLTIDGQTFTVSANTNIIFDTLVNIPVTSKAVVGQIQDQTTVNATGSFVGVSGRVDEQGSELVLKVDSNGKIVSVGLSATATGSELAIVTENFDLISNGLEINNTSGIRLDTSTEIGESDIKEIRWVDGGATYLGFAAIKGSGDLKTGTIYSDFGLAFKSSTGLLENAGYSFIFNGENISHFSMLSAENLDGDLVSITTFRSPSVAKLNFNLVDLPTTNPGGSNRVWNDGGTLKIT